MQIFYTTHINASRATLTQEEANHCSRVLRKSVGDPIHITDGMGGLYIGSIETISKKEVIVCDLELIERQAKKSPLAIAIAPTKNINRLEWFLEKATEIGISEIYPILTKRSERKVIKPERLEKILVAAMKQSQNLYKPVLHNMTKIEELFPLQYPQKYIAHCMQPEQHLAYIYNPDESAIVLVGPEGDFTPEELTAAEKKEWEGISLGTSRLRTETAGIIVAHTVSLAQLKRI